MSLISNLDLVREYNYHIWIYTATDCHKILCDSYSIDDNGFFTGYVDIEGTNQRVFCVPKQSITSIEFR